MRPIVTIVLLLCQIANGKKTDRGGTGILESIREDVGEILKLMKEERANKGFFWPDPCRSHTGPLKNLAYKKKTFQSTTYGSASSDKAVDGISNSNFGANSCACTSDNPFETHPYWYVDLGKEHDIQRVEIKNRGDCCPERLHDVEVTVARHDKRFNVACGTFKGPGIASQTVVLQCLRRTKGRYIKLQIVKGTNNILTICEVKVFGR